MREMTEKEVKCAHKRLRKLRKHQDEIDRILATSPPSFHDEVKRSHRCQAWMMKGSVCPICGACAK